MKRAVALLAAIALQVAGCTAGSVVMIAPPGAARLQPNAPTGEPAPPGLIRYLHAPDRPDLQKKIRGKADRKMRAACGSPFTIGAEGPESSGVAGTLSTALPPLSPGEAIAVAMDQSMKLVTSPEYWYIRFTCLSR